MQELKIDWKELPVNADGLKEFPVRLSEWGRGDTGGYLLRFYRHLRGNRYCCLGCAGAAMGVPDSVQIDLHTVGSALQQLKRDRVMAQGSYLDFSEALRTSGDIALDIISANDEPGLSDDERMAKLTELFAQIGYKPVFINDEATTTPPA